LILQGTSAAGSHRERYKTLLDEILAASRDPLVSKMRDSNQRASKFRRHRAIRVLQQNSPTSAIRNLSLSAVKVDAFQPVTGPCEPCLRRKAWRAYSYPESRGSGDHLNDRPTRSREGLAVAGDTTSKDQGG
jgi:hypothetical protein